MDTLAPPDNRPANLEHGGPGTQAPAAPGPAAERRVRIRQVTMEGVCTLVGAALGGIALTWVLYQRILPTSGAVGFWLCGYVTFLCLYALAGVVQWEPRDVANRLVGVLLVSAGLLVIAVVADQIGYTAVRGYPALHHLNFFTDTMALAGPLDPLTSGGMIHALVGSLEQMGIATVFSVPLGVLCALFLVEVGGPLARPVRTIVEAMTALPEIIAGLFIYAFLILSLGVGASGFAAAVALTVMMIPIVTRTAEVILRLVPSGLREASYALGGSQIRTVLNVVLPTARSGLATAVILAMARAVGETSPVLLTAGFTKDLNANPFSGPQTSLPLYIWNYVRYPQPAMVSRAFGAALALMVMVLLLFALARLIGGKAPGELTRRQRRQLRRAREADQLVRSDREAGDRSLALELTGADRGADAQ
ncbi:phosphate ABC transporter permease PstA [Rugosimonospora africana]|uniref:Phosphate transport system permease protein PstA n=1 Tax=Rugosimonospora africana TaxID=556532 RepID=A0A8J3QZM3_9ACTN|nr:phosphate ABC transporter permease PstA [Rugosimonospora africana]GIH19833.1 phosphate transport system permease protein PstA [Rugosimonospora africana]